MHMRILIHGFRKIIHDTYLKRYFQLRAGSRSELALWEADTLGQMRFIERMFGIAG